MSDMLEQAIVDAEALKEAALKNAEQSIIEKYSDEIKEAVDTLLEQAPMPMPGEEEMGGMGMDPMGGMGMDPNMAAMLGAPGPPEPDQFVEAQPPAWGDGEDLCACPDKEIEISFDQLTDLNQQEPGSPAEMVPHEALAGPMAAAAMGQPPAPYPEEEEALAGMLAEGIEIDETDLEDILEVFANESFKADIRIDDALGIPGHGLHPSADVEEQAQKEEIQIAYEAYPKETPAMGTALDDQIAREQQNEELNKLTKENNKLTKENNKLTENLSGVGKYAAHLEKQTNKFKSILVKLKDRLEEVNLTNAKLLYTNRVLNSTSLNERQKKRIAESISKVESVEEAKVIFETLQSTVSGVVPRRTPKSLSEAVRRSSTTLPRKSEAKPVLDPVSARWRALAGLNNSKGGK